MNDAIEMLKFQLIQQAIDQAMAATQLNKHFSKWLLQEIKDYIDLVE